MPEEKKKLIDEILDKVDEGQCSKEMYLRKIREVRKFYNGHYNLYSDTDLPSGGVDDADSAGFIKSHKMFTKIRNVVSTLVFPADFKYVITGANSNNSLDWQTAKTAEAIARYYWKRQSLWRLARTNIVDTFLYNRGYIRIGLMADEGAAAAGYVEGGNKVPGHAFAERVRPDDVVLAPGFNSINEAYATGGWVAIRSTPHVDWVNENPAYTKSKKVLADTAIRNYDPDDIKDDGEQSKEEDNPAKGPVKYAVIWEFFQAPTPKYPRGRYFVVHRKTEQVLYKADRLPYGGIGFPIRENIFFEPQDTYWGSPIAYRAIAPLTEYELFETKSMNLNANIKHIIATNSRQAADQINDQLDAIADVGVVDMTNLTGGGPLKDSIQDLPIQFDTTPVDIAAQRALGRFEELFMPDIVGARQGDKIATEMRLQGVSAIQEANDQKTVINMFWVDIMRDMLVITRQGIPQEEIVRMTRQADMTFSLDEDEVTLDGDYAMVIKTKPILDMTQGEYHQTLNMQMQVMAQFLPIFGERLGDGPIAALKEWMSEVGMPTFEIMSGPQMTQDVETGLLMSGIDMPVHPSDDHIKHATKMLEFKNRLEMAGQQQDVFTTQQGWAMFMKHLQTHIKIGEQQSEGSTGGPWAQIKNAVNNSREAGGKTFSNQGQAAVQK